MEDTSSATRHLSAGAYLDDVFRRRVLREVVNDRTRAAAPEFGIEPALVVAHCKRAGTLRLFHGAALSAILVAIAIVTPFLLVWLAVLGLVTAIFRYRAVMWTTVVLGVLILAPGVFFVVFEPSVIADLVGGLTDFAAGLGAEWGPPDPATWSLLALLAAVALATALVRTILLTLIADGRLSSHRELARFPAEADLVIYSAGHPFAGSGKFLRGSRSTFPLRPADGPAAPFTTGELVASLRAGMVRLGSGVLGPSHLAGLTVADQVFLAGTSALSTVRSVDGHFATDGVMAAVIENPSPSLRHFLRCQVVAWSGELVTTVYTHAAIEDAVMHLESATFALPPTRAGFHVFGAKRRTGAAGFARNALRALAMLPLDAVTAPFMVFGAFGDIAVSDSRRTRHDRGAPASIRELGAGHLAPQHLQQRDMLRHAETMERQVFAEAAVFLAAKGIDTAELDRRAGPRDDLTRT
ncbi:hypothetical protein AB0I28_04750 [Phytomonospora sp. NPDC050363]|uniref:hypothetical protein n=1 Tax=Phytomonospora sp. NPDC050363 TaxID=3155642 RepID=UPI0033CDE30D